MQIITVGLLLFATICGFDRPESVIRYQKNIYVSNINGTPLQKNGKGYISLLTYRGKLVKRKFITGVNAPKGMAVHEGVLYVTDIDVVRSFRLKDGKKLNVVKIPGAKFLNDICVKYDGTLYVTDSFAHKIHKIVNGKVSLFTNKIKFPNGIAESFDGGFYVAQMKGSNLYKIERNGNIRILAKGIYAGDGVGEGAYHRYVYVSSIRKGKIFKVRLRDGKVTVIYSGLKTPADIWVDHLYKRILIPQMMKGCVSSVKIK